MNIQKIESKENAKVKLLKKLQQRKVRHEAGLFKVENFKTISDATMAGNNFEMLFITIEFRQEHDKALVDLSARNQSAEYYELPENIYNSFTELEAPEGICAVYRISPAQIDETRPILYLNGINDPGNLGTILRSASAFDFGSVIVDGKCADIYNHKTIQAAKNSIFSLNILADEDRKILTEMKNKKIELAALALTARAVELDDWRPGRALCLILGSESHGIDSDVMALADKAVKINISKNIESLNVNSAAAIAMRCVYQQR